MNDWYGVIFFHSLRLGAVGSPPMNPMAGTCGRDDDNDVVSRAFPFALGLEVDLETPDLAMLANLVPVLVVAVRTLMVEGSTGLILALEEEADGGARALTPHSESESESDSFRFRLEGDILAPLPITYTDGHELWGKTRKLEIGTKWLLLGKA